MKILFFLAFLSLVADATTIYVDSNALSTTNSSGLATLDLTGPLAPNPEWAPAQPGSFWISYGSTGYYEDPWYFSPPDGTEVTFTTDFTLSGDITGASLVVLADYTASVFLNGHLLFPAAQRAPQNCAGQPPGCIASSEDVFTFAELDSFLVDGVNSLSFGVVQLGGGSFGLDFAGSIVEAVATPAGSSGDLIDSTPEPASVVILGGGLAALGILCLRKQSPLAASSGNLRADARKFSPI